MLEYEKSLIPNARELRKNATPWERKLWHLFLSSYPVRFQRQKTIYRYIVDFYCAKARLAIEVDGSGHYESDQKVYDDIRTEILNNCGITVLRLSNHDVDHSFSEVCAAIDAAVRHSLPQSASPTAPSSEGAKT